MWSASSVCHFINLLCGVNPKKSWTRRKGDSKVEIWFLIDNFCPDFKTLTVSVKVFSAEEKDVFRIDCPHQTTRRGTSLRENLCCKRRSDEEKQGKYAQYILQIFIKTPSSLFRRATYFASSHFVSPGGQKIAISIYAILAYQRLCTKSIQLSLGL